MQNLLVRTKAQNKVDARVRLLFENGSCDVWVRECGLCDYKGDASGSLDCVDRVILMIRMAMVSLESCRSVSL